MEIDYRSIIYEAWHEWASSVQPGVMYIFHIGDSAFSLAERNKRQAFRGQPENGEVRRWLRLMRNARVELK